MLQKTIISNDEIARKRFLLRILLFSIIILALFAFISNLYGVFFIKHYGGVTPLITGAVFMFYCILFLLSKKTKSSYISYIFVLSLFIINVLVTVSRGADLPTALLFYSLIIVIAGMLLSAKSGIVISITSAIVIFIIAHLQMRHVYHINEYWRYKEINFQDTIIYTVMLGVIAVVSWLSNREIEKSLKRARDSEIALQKERDNLEEMVQRRTFQLRQAEVEKFAQFYHTIEFGKLAVGLFHDLVTPLNIISLSLENINEESKVTEKNKASNIKRYLKRAMYGTKHLETFLAIARKQIQDSKQMQHFSLSEEIENVVKLFRYNLNNAKVTILYKKREEINYYGNPLKFNQIITNLLSNAIDSYTTLKKVNKKKIIKIELYSKRKKLHLIVSDNGVGMRRKDIKKIFDPFFSSKEEQNHLGFGLYLVKEIIQKDFHGTILVRSKLFQGTTFCVTFPMNEV